MQAECARSHWGSMIIQHNPDAGFAQTSEKAAEKAAEYQSTTEKAAEKKATRGAGGKAAEEAAQKGAEGMEGMVRIRACIAT